MDDIDFDEADEIGEGAGPVRKSVYKSARWRPQIAKRLRQRVGLIFAWLRITVLPQYGWRILGSMILISCGKLGEAASFVTGTHFLTRSLSQADGAGYGVQGAIAGAALAMGGILAVASILSYFGHKLAAGLVLTYEDNCLVRALEIIRHHEQSHQKLSKAEVANVIQQAPRTMSRSLMYIINACTSLGMMLVGLGTCMYLFPGLTAAILLSLAVISPAYVFAAIHSTNIGHSIRLGTAGYTALIKGLRRWIPSVEFDRHEIEQEIRADMQYNAYQNAYRARLALPALNQLLSNLTLAFVLALSLMWISSKIDFSPRSIAAMVSYLVSLRLFAHGLGGIFHGIQSVNASLPFYLLFLDRDPRLAKSE